jgi:hypothetical protein
MVFCPEADIFAAPEPSPGSLEPTAVAGTLQFEVPMASRPTFDAAQLDPIEGFVILRCRAVFHAEQATQSNPEASRHVADAYAQVLAPAAQNRPNDDEPAFAFLGSIGGSTREL